MSFISDLIDHLEGEYNVDPARIYANSLSNGGGMSFALSCKLSERNAAIGSVAGAYLLPWDICNPSRPVPVIVFHGNADPIVPFTGGLSRSFDIPSSHSGLTEGFPTRLQIRHVNVLYPRGGT